MTPDINRKRLLVIYCSDDLLSIAVKMRPWRLSLYFRLFKYFARLGHFHFSTLEKAVNEPIGRYITFICDIQKHEKLHAIDKLFREQKVPCALEICFNSSDNKLSDKQIANEQILASANTSTAITSALIAPLALPADREILSCGQKQVNLTTFNRKQQSEYIEQLQTSFLATFSRNLRFLVYPNGTYDVDLIHCLRHHGFIGALTQTHGVNDRGYDSFQLKTIPGAPGRILSLFKMLHLLLKPELPAHISTPRERRLKRSLR